MYPVLLFVLAYAGADVGSRYADANHVDAPSSGYSPNDSGASWWYVTWGGVAGLILGVVVCVVVEVVLARRRRKHQSGDRARGSTAL
jgi:heme/copper-type cytochrome/quinol oxidase subunit 2